MTEGYEIRSGGKLVHTFWHYDEEKDEGGWQEKDVTDESFSHLWKETSLADDVTLKDIFLLINRHLEVFDVLLGNWCAELTEEALSGQDAEEDTDIEYLELYKYYELGEVWENGELLPDVIGPLNTAFPSFHGKGFLRTEKDRNDGQPFRENYAVELSPTYKIVDLPLKLNRELVIFDDPSWHKEFKAGNKPNFEDYTISYPWVGYTLGEILYGIVWELSFFGGPQKRDDMMTELKERVDEIESGEAELIEVDDEYFDRLKEKIRKGKQKDDEEDQ